MEKYKTQIDDAWDNRAKKMDWLALESLLVEILSDTILSDSEKVVLSKEAIDAFTKRGHFA